MKFNFTSYLLFKIMLMSQFIVLVENYQQTCIRASDQAIGQFNDGNIGQFINNGILNIPCGVRDIQMESISSYYQNNIIEVIIPDSVISIKESAFAGSFVINVTMGDSVIEIEDRAFTSCVQLQNIKISNSLVYIGEGAFAHCDQLKEINLPNSLIYIDQYAFEYSGLTSIVIPNSVQEIGDYAFQNCYNLENIVLSNQLKIIDYYAFSSCSNLKTINIPNSVEIIRNFSFDHCQKLQCIAIMNKNCNINEFAFQNTSFQDNYMNYVGEDKRCFENGYNYCNQTGYDYITDINDLYTCTIVDNVDYYYKTEIDEEEVNVRVENCEQINYQYQIQGIPIECVENCGDLYIQEQYCVNHCDEEHEYIQNGECVISCTIDQYPYIQNNECVTECSEEYPLIQDKYCVIQCSQNYQLQNNECIPQDINQNPNNNLSLILGITIPVILVIIITITSTIFVCRKKKHQNTQDKNIINKQKQNQQKLNEEQKLTGIIKSDNLKPINIELQDQQNHFNNQMLSPTQKKYEFKYRKQNL